MKIENYTCITILRIDSTRTLILEFVCVRNLPFTYYYFSNVMAMELKQGETDPKTILTFDKFFVFHVN